jgi:mannose-6-phosphate isomerase-like protein (cupin superfamily)
MEKEILEIAQRIRALREIEEVDEKTMADTLGMPLSEYTLYEEGQKDFPFSFLYTVANKLKVDITDLLTGQGAKLQVFSLVRQGQGLQMERRRAYKYQHLAPIFKNRIMEPFLVKVEPKDTESAVAKNAHAGHEINYIVSGSMTFYIDDNTVLMKEGDLVYFDASHPHAMQAENGQSCEFLAIISK